MPSSPSWAPGAETSSIVIATRCWPLAGSMRVMRLPVRSVTQSMLSGPHVSSQGPPSPDTRTLLRNSLVPCKTESGPSCARTGPQNNTGYRKNR